MIPKFLNCQARENQSLLGAWEACLGECHISNGLLPIIPLALVNGCKGIGFGWKCDIPCYNPLEIISYIKRLLLRKKEHIKLKPFYRRFKGSIIEEGDDIKARFRTVGCAEVISDNTIKVTELPIHTWTENYKASIKSDELVKVIIDLNIY
jgi:DNA topoisomerase-2